ncbi:MAG: beta-ketoacyl synthase N-terminal-like domain-containing protein [Candidatus Melainabacteria bacterium]|nr:beta-ketoacyl synthase N-terminal-like domain-containing protein [Candidatus Melainabacteria bacterium]
MQDSEKRKSGKIAIIGMACLYPGAPDLASFWSNIVGGVDATREVSDREWKLEDNYDPDATTFGKTYSKRGGFISEYAEFDPLKYGVMPSGVAGGDPDQFLTLRVAHQAMADAGYLNKPFPADRAEIILGRISAPGAGSMNLVHQSKTVNEISDLLRGLLPDREDGLVDNVIADLRSKLVSCNSDTLPSAMPNVLAGRIAAKLGFRGRNLLIDAACASSMVAIETAVNDLNSGLCDFALAGGLHVNASSVFFQMFCGLGALSRKDEIRPFDEAADGTLLGEGIGIICLKRHEDAVADGDRIYATICGVASSSDGHGGSVLSPNLEGEALAMEKAYRMAGISPRTVGLLEGHGTGTPTGDVVELQAIEKIFTSKEMLELEKSPKDIASEKKAAEAKTAQTKAAETKSANANIPAKTQAATAVPEKTDAREAAAETTDAKEKENSAEQSEPWCAIGSVKSMIGHCQSASAVAGVIKTVLALHHKILPPTLNVTRPNEKINWKTHPCYINTHSRPWIHPLESGHARRAAVSAFGFGGINGHMILEEATQDIFVELGSQSTNPTALMRQWESELFTFENETAELLVESIRKVSQFVKQSADVNLKDLAHTLNCKPATETVPSGTATKPAAAETSSDSVSLNESQHRLAIVANNRDALLAKLDQAIASIQAGKVHVESERGLYLTKPGTALGGKLAFLYPGLGSAYTGMLSELCMHFPEVRAVFDIVDTVALSNKSTLLPSNMIFPRPTPGEAKSSTDSLASADFAVVAVLLAEYALYQLMLHLDIKPDALMGCSTGEFAAITTGGAVDVLSAAELFYNRSTRVAQTIPADKLANLRSLRVLAPAATVMSLVTNNDVYLSADLGEKHIIVTGSIAGITALTEKLAQKKIALQKLPTAIPYHTPLVNDLVDGDDDSVKSLTVRQMTIPAWACSTGGQYPDDVETLRSMFTELFTRPVRMRETIQSMHAQGVRKFIEVGPNGVLTSLVSSILGDAPHVAVPTNLASRSALTQVHHLLAALYVQGIDANFAFLYKRRAPISLDLNAIAAPEKTVSKLSLRHTKLEVSPEYKVALENSCPQPNSHGNGNGNATASSAITGQGTNVSVPQGMQADAQPGGFDQTQYPSIAQPAQSEEEDVVRSFLNTNSNFYSRMSLMQQRVMSTMLSGSENGSYQGDEHSQSFEGSQGSVSNSVPAFMNRFAVSQQGDQSFIDLFVDLQNDLYLLDHAIGGSVSADQEGRVYLMPLMVSLEIMAEAGAVHSQQSLITRVEQVKAYRRIVVDRNGTALRMVVTGDSRRVHVQMFELNQTGTLVLEADFNFSQHYDTRANQQQIQVAGDAPVNLIDRSQLYTPPAMFHGPRMQAVLSLDKIGNRTITGRADSSPAQNWIPGVPVARLLLHPLLLDNASQFVLFYLYEKNLPAIALLPFLIESIEFFSPSEMLPPVVTGLASLQTLSDRSTEAKVEVVDANNAVWMRVNGINSRRIAVNEHWLKYVYDPLNTYVGSRLDVNSDICDKCVLTAFDQQILPQDEAVLDWCLDYLLTKNERIHWRDTLKFEKRKLEWLIGRIVAKEAVRRLIKDRLNLSIGPLDIEIEQDDRRRPIVKLAYGGIGEILLSISHSAGLGLSLCSFAADGNPGIDAEVIESREDDFASRFLDKEELQFLDSSSKQSRAMQVTRLWSAKEAAYKSLGGILEMTSFSLVTPIAPAGALTLSNKQCATTFSVSTEVSGNRVLSYTLLSPLQVRSLMLSGQPA